MKVFNKTRVLEKSWTLVCVRKRASAKEGNNMKEMLTKLESNYYNRSWMNSFTISVRPSIEVGKVQCHSPRFLYIYTKAPGPRKKLLHSLAKTDNNCRNTACEMAKRQSARLGPAEAIAQTYRNVCSPILSEER